MKYAPILVSIALSTALFAGCKKSNTETDGANQSGAAAVGPAYVGNWAASLDFLNDLPADTSEVVRGMMKEDAEKRFMRITPETITHHFRTRTESWDLKIDPTENGQFAFAASSKRSGKVLEEGTFKSADQKTLELIPKKKSGTGGLDAAPARQPLGIGLYDRITEGEYLRRKARLDAELELLSSPSALS